MTAPTEDVCPECGRNLIWTGAVWAAHDDEYHQDLRHILNVMLWRQAGREVWRRATGV